MKFKYLFFSPGYLILVVAYYWPREWGKERSVAKSSRQWNVRHTLAPIYSVLIYGILIYYFFSIQNIKN